MENFSKFFDSAVSGYKNTTQEPETNASTNNDNNIYNSNNINKVEPEIDNHVFPSEDYYLLSNEIILSASRLHKELYDSLTLPYAFIAFYFSEFNKYTELQTHYLKKFLVLFDNKKNNVANAITIFTKTYTEHAEIKFIKKSSLFNDLKQGYYLEISEELSSKVVMYATHIDNNLKTAINETRKICETIKNTTSEKNFKYNYVDFLSKSNTTENAIPTVAEIKLDEEQNATIVTPTRKKQYIAPPKQTNEGKVSNISLPILKLGKQYITSLTHSRIDSAHFAFRFMEPADTYELIRKYRFKRVKYTNGFETKRKSLFEEKKSSFDLY